MKKNKTIGIEKFTFFIFTFGLFFFQHLPDATANIVGNRALVYDGPGACPEDCAKAAVDHARLAGLKVTVIGPQTITDLSTEQDIADLFKDVVLYMQPGGKSSTAMKAMHPRQIQAVKDFIKNGGGYVGFCAGAFASTAIVGTTTTAGFGFMPGNTKLYDQPVGNPGIEKIIWNGQQRQIYWEGGPFHKNLSRVTGVDVVATYSDGSVASLKTQHGCGKVFVTGLHPEAPTWWKTSSKLQDTDGDDADLVLEMIRWSVGDSNKDPANGCRTR